MNHNYEHYEHGKNVKPKPTNLATKYGWAAAACALALVAAINFIFFK
jgi:hypothetical protein